MNFTNVIKSITPPITLCFFRWLNKSKSVNFSGKFRDWSTAAAAAKGYQTDQILENAIKTTSSVVSGGAEFERDGVTFNHPDYTFELISTLLLAASENNNHLNVIDFGGALGSTYHQSKLFLSSIDKLAWDVVEQPQYVDAGNLHFSNEILNFHYAINDIIALRKPHIIIFSGVLQYLPEPYRILKEAIAAEVDYIIIDRTPFTEVDKTLISLQTVPKRIVESSYPVWLFSESELKHNITGYKELFTFPALDGVIGFGELKANFKGIIYKRQ